MWVYGPFAGPDAEPLTETRQRQTERWLTNAAREAKRQATIAAKRS